MQRFEGDIRYGSEVERNEMGVFPLWVFCKKEVQISK